MYGPLNPDRPRRLAYCHSLSLIHVWQVENLSPFSVTDARQKLWLNTKDPVQSSGLSVIAISSYRAAVDQGPFCAVGIRKAQDEHGATFRIQRRSTLLSAIGSTGFQYRCRHIFRADVALVPIHGLELSEWTLDVRQSSISRINLLGSAGLQHDPPSTETTDHPLLSSILHMQAPLLVQLKTPLDAQRPQQNTHQCNLVSSSGDR